VPQTVPQTCLRSGRPGVVRRDRILLGPFADLVGKLDGRVRALLDMMGHGAPSAGFLSGYARVFAMLRKLLFAFTLKYAWD
jgi:serine phosphatase RsbU (regulator of sigma subunit)